MPRRLIPIAFVLLILLYSPASAQVSIGIEAGAAFPKLLNILQGYNAGGGSVASNSQSITRFSGGFLADIPLEKKQFLIIRPSLLYLGAGGQTPSVQDFNGNLLSGGTVYNFDYVQLPLQLLYSPAVPFGKLWIGGGMYGSIMVNAMAGTSANQQFLTIGSDVKRFDMGYIASAGFSFKCGVFLGADYQQSLGTIVPNQPTGSAAVRNSVWGLRVGYIANAGGGSHSH